MQPSKLTAKEESYIISEPRLDYIPNPLGLGFELYHSMLVNGNVVAQIDAESEDTDTYGCLLRRCVRTCTNLLLRGFNQNDVICVCSSNHSDTCVPIISALFLAVKGVCLDPSLSSEDIKTVLSQARPRAIFVSPDVVDLISVICVELEMFFISEIIVFGDSTLHTTFAMLQEPVQGESYFKPLPLSNIRETAFIWFIVDPIGEMRRICLSHFTLMVQIVNATNCWNLGKKLYMSNYRRAWNDNGFKRIVYFNSCFNMSSIIILICCLMTGTTRIICREFEATKAWRIIDKYQVSFMLCTTFQAEQLYKIEKPETAEGKTLRMLVTTGTSLSKPILFELRKLFPRCFVTNVYIQEEVAGFLTMFNYTKPSDIRDQYERPTSSGKLCPGISCKIVDPLTEKILSVNEPGELRYKADFVMDAYYKIDSDVVYDTNDWIKSNDIGFYDEKRCIHVLDPWDDVFKFKCWYIIPSILETVIKQHPAIKNAVVIGIPYKKKNFGEKTMAIVSLKKNMSDKVTEQSIENFINSILSSKQKIRSGVKIMRNIPLTLMGRLKREEIRTTILNELNVL